MKKLLLLLCLALLSLCLLCACDNEENAVGVSGVEINENGEAVVTLTDGTTHNAGVPAHGHTYGSWTDYSAENSTVGCDRRVYYRTCSGCGDLEWKTGGAHSFAVLASTPATCTAAGSETKSCTVCGKTQTDALPILPHAYQSTYSCSGSHHWYQCADCDATKEKDEHTAGTDGLCAVCYNPTGPTEGILYAVNGDHAEVLGYTGTATKILIADTYQDRPVTTIGANAFKEKSITSVIIPASVTSIGDDAFYSCDSLNAVTIPAGVTSIGEWAFSHCDSLTAVTFAANSQLQSIGSYVFSFCDSLTAVTIPASVTSISEGMFNSCNSLTAISIPASVTSIGDHAFSGCGLTAVTFAPNSQLQRIDSYAFVDCSSLTSISIPAGVTSIRYSAFQNCNRLTSVTFAPNSQLQSIGSDAFLFCESLTAVYITDLAAWCKIEFNNSAANPLYYAKALYLNGNKVTTLEIPTDVTSIGKWTFVNCSELTSVTIPASMTSINGFAFSGCSKLTSVIFESKTGWTAGGTPVTADMLNDPALAAVYLTATYAGSDWHRTVS